MYMHARASLLALSAPVSFVALFGLSRLFLDCFSCLRESIVHRSDLGLLGARRCSHLLVCGSSGLLGVGCFLGVGWLLQDDFVFFVVLSRIRIVFTLSQFSYKIGVLLQHLLLLGSSTSPLGPWH
jgi:hypothetical protein